MELRASEEKRLQELGGELALGNVISTNITMLDGGLQVNIVPAVMKARVDFRLPPTLDFDDFDKQLRAWAAEAGSDVEVCCLILCFFK